MDADAFANFLSTWRLLDRLERVLRYGGIFVIIGGHAEPVQLVSDDDQCDGDKSGLEFDPGAYLEWYGAGQPHCRERAGDSRNQQHRRFGKLDGNPGEPDEYDGLWANCRFRWVRGLAGWLPSAEWRFPRQCPERPPDLRHKQRQSDDPRSHWWSRDGRRDRD